MEEEPNSQMDHLQPDPLLKAGAFIDPNLTSNDASSNSNSFTTVDPPPVDPNPSQPSDQEAAVTPNGKPKPKPKPRTKAKPKPKAKATLTPIPKGESTTTVDPTVEGSQPSDEKGETPSSQRPDWLPAGWEFIERVRASGASAGSRDKYYVEPVSKRRFRSKKEVTYFLETGSTKKKKNADSDADSTPAADSSAKRKKSEPKAKNSPAADSSAKRKKPGPKPKKPFKNFNFDNVPEKVKWELSDIYEGTWRPLMNGADRVPESAKQEWIAAFTYLTLQIGGDNAQIVL